MLDASLAELFPEGHGALLEQLLGVRDGLRLAVVGGAVRDLLLHRDHRDPWRGLCDLDLVVEGAPSQADLHQEAPAQGLVKRLLDRLDPVDVAFCHVHGRFGTVELECAGLLLDIASARSECYPVPAENPSVAFGKLEDDLARRDFTINAMALVLDAQGGQMLDPHGGRQDLADRQLRLLHDRSLRDDPTRLVRGARYAARLGFNLEASSLSQAQQTLSAWPWPWSFGDAPELAPPALGTRLRMELELLLEREPWEQALSLLQRWGGLKLLDPVLQDEPGLLRGVRRAERLGLTRLVALVAMAAEPVALAQRLQLPHQQQRLLHNYQQFAQRLEQLDLLSIKAWSPAVWTAWIESSPQAEQVVALALAVSSAHRRPLLHWWFRWRHVRAEVTAHDLLRQGWTPGPALGERLRELRAERLDQQRWTCR